jgi:hypothetical protein
VSVGVTPLAEFFGGGANDAVTAVLAITVAAVLRVLWNLHERVSRLEGLDEMRERMLNSERQDEDDRGDPLV